MAASPTCSRRLAAGDCKIQVVTPSGCRALKDAGGNDATGIDSTVATGL